MFSLNRSQRDCVRNGSRRHGGHVHQIAPHRSSVLGELEMFVDTVDVDVLRRAKVLSNSQVDITKERSPVTRSQSKRTIIGGSRGGVMLKR